MKMATPPVNPVIQSLNWILGKWRCDDGLATYPTMLPFMFECEIEFSQIGQPNIHFSSLSWHPESKQPLHRETGFIRVQPDSNKVAFITSHNIGLSTVEEGEHVDRKITLESTTVGRMSFVQGTETRKIKRTFEMEGSQLVQTMAMETNKTPMTHHLKIRYAKID